MARTERPPNLNNGRHSWCYCLRGYRHRREKHAGHRQCVRGIRDTLHNIGHCGGLRFYLLNCGSIDR